MNYRFFLHTVLLIAAFVMSQSVLSQEMDGAEALSLVSNPALAVSSDGSIPPTTEAVKASRGEPSFEGTGPTELAEGATADALAEFAGTPESAEEVWKLWNLKPETAPVGTETIIGADNRVRVNPTTRFPARAVALITFTGGRCTGWLYGNNIVATAGHCVHSGGSGGSWRTNVRVYPGRNGALSPYGSCSARTLYSVTGWTSSANEQYDYGAIKLNCRIGNTTGWFGYFRQSANLTGLPTIISGYPGDKPLEQWKSTDVVRVTQAKQIFYANDTVGGMSGAPVYYNKSGCGYCSMAIHTYGLHGSWPHSIYNHGTRIDQSVYNNLYSWKNAP